MDAGEPLGDDQIELLFLGTGTSAGVPMIACHCETCTSTDSRDKRTRPSVLISYRSPSHFDDGLGSRDATRRESEDRATRGVAATDASRDDHLVTVLVDTTPELRLQCIANGVDSIDAIVFTHAHADHIMGLDDVRRFNAVRLGPLDVYADDRTFTSLERVFGYAFREPAPDMKVFRPHLIRHRIAGPFEIAGVRWTPVPLLHGEMPILGFRVGNLAYCTDVSRIPEPSYDLLHNLDVLVLDALQWKPHVTHFSVDEAIAAAKRTGAKRTYFTHIAHALKHAPTNEKLPNDVRLAHDGLRIRASLSLARRGQGRGSNA